MPRNAPGPRPPPLRRPPVLRHAFADKAPRYTPRRPERTDLYKLVSEHLEEFLRTAHDEHERDLPRYVEQELRAYLDCGILAHGFVHGRCTACGLSTPFEIRLLLAANAGTFSVLTRIFAEEVLALQRRRGGALGLWRSEGGLLAFQYRFGGSLNLNTAHRRLCQALAFAVSSDASPRAGRLVLWTCSGEGSPSPEMSTTGSFPGSALTRRWSTVAHRQVGKFLPMGGVLASA